MAYQNRKNSLSSIERKIFNKFYNVAYIEIRRNSANKNFIEIEPENKTALNVIIEYLDKNNLRYSKSNIGNRLFVFGKK